DDGSTAGHRLEDREAEPLVERRIENASRTAVEGSEICIRYFSHPAAHVHPAPAARPDDPELDPGEACGLDGAGEVLAWLECGDRQHVVAPGRRPVGGENLVDAIGND